MLCREAESACAEQRALANAAHAAMQARATAEAAAAAEAAVLQASLSAVAADLTRMHSAADAAAIKRAALHAALQVLPQRGCCCSHGDTLLGHCQKSSWGIVNNLPASLCSMLGSADVCL